MSERNIFQLPPEYVTGDYGKITITRDEVAQRLSIIGIIDGYPVLLLDGEPAQESEQIRSSAQMVTRHYLYRAAQYTQRGKWELISRWESEIDVPHDPKESSYTYYGQMEFGEAMVLDQPIPYLQVAWNALMPRWEAELENRRRNGKQIN